MDKGLGSREVEEATDARDEPQVVEGRLADSLYKTTLLTQSRGQH